jgi:DNA-binding HxlR family transcriptional regulator
MLAGRIRYAEIREGVVERRVVPESPVRVEYHLTQKGRALQGAVAAIAAWAEEWTEEVRSAEG